MWSEVGAIYRASKKKRDINRFTEYVARPPAAVVVYALRNTRVTPNQVTFGSLVVCAGACALFLLAPGRLGLILAALAYELSFILDCADGQLARLRKTASPLGHLLDFLMDEIKAFLVFASVTWRLWHDSGDVLFLQIGLAGLAALAAGISVTSFMRRPEYGAAKEWTEDGQPAQVASRSGMVGGVLTLLEHAARIVVHYPAYIWLCAALGRLDVFFWAYAAVNVLYLGRSMLLIAFKLGRFS